MIHTGSTEPVMTYAGNRAPVMTHVGRTAPVITNQSVGSLDDNLCITCSKNDVEFCNQNQLCRVTADLIILRTMFYLLLIYVWGRNDSSDYYYY